MATKLHGVKDNLQLTAASGVGSTDTSISLASGQGATCPDEPFWVTWDYEQIEVTDVTGDVMTVTRGVNGTTPSVHTTSSKIELRNVAALFEELQDRLDYLMAFITYAWGGGDGVIRNWGDELEVVAQTTPDMTVKVQTGSGMVSLRLVRLTSDETTDAIAAPTTNPRIDLVQIDQYDTVSIVTGTEAATPSAPSPTANNMALAQIYCPVGMAHIDDTDGGDGYITDARSFV